MLTDGQTDGRMTDAGVTGILIAHLGAFGSVELITNDNQTDPDRVQLVSRWDLGPDCRHSRRHKSYSEQKNHKVGRTIIFNEYQQTRVIADDNRKLSTDSPRRPLSIIDIFRIIHVYTVLLVVSTNVPIDNQPVRNSINGLIEHKYLGLHTRLLVLITSLSNEGYDESVHKDRLAFAFYVRNSKV